MVRTKVFRGYALGVTCLCLYIGASTDMMMLLLVVWSALLVMPFLVGMALARTAWKTLLESGEREKWKCFITEHGIEKHQAGRVDVVPWESVSSLTNNRSYIYAKRGARPILLAMERHLSEKSLHEIEEILHQVRQNRLRLRV